MSELMKPSPSPSVLAWAAAQEADDLRITAVTTAEIRSGVERLPEGQRRRDLQLAADRLITAFGDRCLPFNDTAAGRYGSIVAHRERIGRPISVLDAFIAATAQAHNARMATRDTGGFAETGIPVINPFTD
ncbi:MAG: type II toxin-antitoxin system VapC family toxin [Aeromicrobium sp.]|uniref:type II toxin-antitoxin system VapC family toxin n=1 Tax=Aeromicrobium sp. TaxID=1871063 RepID=UPI0039E65356